MTNTIDILLSTYNGAKYLREQLDSILKQTYTSWRLIVRDDSSTDDTLKIIKEYINKYPNFIIHIKNTRNIGVVKSFELLLKNSTSKYIMFCDQDDIWLNNKIEVTLKKMIEEESKNADKAILIHTDLVVVNERLQTIYNSFWKYSRIKPELLTNFDYLSVHNVATGCTIMINEKAKFQTQPFTERTLMHDSWIALSVVKNSGIIAFVNTPLMLYRQHGDNVVGAKNRIDSYLKNKFLAIDDVIKQNIKQYKMVRSIKRISLARYIYFKIKYFLNIRL